MEKAQNLSKYYNQSDWKRHPIFDESQGIKTYVRRSTFQNHGEIKFKKGTPWRAKSRWGNWLVGFVRGKRRQTISKDGLTVACAIQRNNQVRIELDSDGWLLLKILFIYPNWTQVGFLILVLWSKLLGMERSPRGHSYLEGESQLAMLWAQKSDIEIILFGAIIGDSCCSLVVFLPCCCSCWCIAVAILFVVVVRQT